MVNAEILYSIMPIYGEAAIMVLQGASLRDVIERAFDCKLVYVAQVHLDVEYYPEEKERVTFYGVMSAIGRRADSYSVLCSATIITYHADESRVRLDLESVKNVCPLLRTEVKNIVCL